MNLTYNEWTKRTEIQRTDWKQLEKTLRIKNKEKEGFFCEAGTSYTVFLLLIHFV